MLRILILCILLYVQPAVFRNIERHYDREYEKGIIKRDIWDKENELHSAQSRSERYLTESADDRRRQEIADYNYNNTYYSIDSAENKHSSIIKLFDDIYKPSPAIINSRKSSDDSTTQQKEENVTMVLLRIADAIEGLNKNLKGLGKDYPNRIPLHEKSLYRHKRDVSDDASNKTVAIHVEVIDGNVPAKEESHAKDGQNSAIKENKEIENKLSKNDSDKNIGIPITRTQNKESPTITKDKIIKDSNGATEDKKINGTDKNAIKIEKAAPIKDTAVNVNISTKENITNAAIVPVRRSGNKNDEIISSEANTSTETKLRSETDKTKDISKDITAANDNSVSDEDSLTMENSYTIDNSSAINDTPNASVYIKVNVTNGRRSFPGETSSPRIKEKLLVYLEDMFDELANKVQPLTRVKIALSPDNSYRIGYIVANIDTLDIKLKRLKRNMYLNKDYWDDDKMIDLFDNLRVTNSVVTSLMETLTSYLAVPLL